MDVDGDVKDTSHETNDLAPYVSDVHCHLQKRRSPRYAGFFLCCGDFGVGLRLAFFGLCGSGGVLSMRRKTSFSRSVA